LAIKDNLEAAAQLQAALLLARNRIADAYSCCVQAIKRQTGKGNGNGQTPILLTLIK
jgi:hypothetical protein